MLVSALAAFLTQAAHGGKAEMAERFGEGRMFSSFAPALEPVAELASVLVNRAGNVVWILDPNALELWSQSLDPVPNLETLKSVERSNEGTRATSALVPAGPLFRQRTKLPKELKGEPGEPLGPILVAGIDSASAWVVDVPSRTAWKLGQAGWSRPMELPAKPVSVVASDSGELFASLENRTVVGLRLSGNGESELRRLTALPSQGFAEPWRLAWLDRGSLLAVDARQGIAVSLADDGSLHETLSLPAQIQGLDVSSVATDARGWLYFEAEGASQWWVIDAQGGLRGTLRLPLTRGERPFRGIAVSEQRLVRADTQGVRTHLSLEASRFTGQVVGPNGAPRPGVQVQLISEAGLGWLVGTDDLGKFSILPQEPAVTARVSAFVEPDLFVSESGTIVDLLRTPLRLQPAPRVCLRVVDEETGLPVKSFRVLVGAPNPTVEVDGERPVDMQLEALQSSLESMVARSSEGESCIAVRSLPPWRLTVLASGFSSQELTVESSDLDRLVSVLLKPAASLHLSVQDQTGEGISGVEVALLRRLPESSPGREARQVVRGTSDAQGRVELEDLQVGAWELEATHPDYLPTRGSLDLRGSVEEVVTLARGSALVASIRTDYGDPIQGAVVSVEAVTGGTPPRECETDETGECLVAGLSEKRFKVRARADGHTNAFTTVALEQGDSSVSVALELRSSLELSGKLVGMEQFPKATFRVSVTSPGSSWLHTRVARDGSYRIENAPSGDVTLLVSADPGWALILLKRLELPAGEEYQLDLELPEATVVWGEVRIDGSPCGSCGVSFAQLGALYNRQHFPGTTSPSGEYRLELPRAGSYKVEVRLPSGARLVDIVSVDGTGPLPLYRETSSLRGAVLDAAGNPVVRSPVVLTEALGDLELARSVTDGQGWFAFEGVVSQTVRITARSAAQVKFEQVALEAGQEHYLEVVLPDRRQLRFRLYDQAAGKPILAPADFALVAGDGATVVVQGQLPDSSGTYNLPSPGDDPRAAVVRVRGYAIETLHRPTAATSMKLFLDNRYRTFTFEVGEDFGAPCSIEAFLEGKPVALSPEYPPGPIPMTQPGDRLSELKAGRYSIVLHRCDGSSVRKSAHLQVGETPHLVFD